MCGDLFIRQTLHHHLQHFPLPKGKVFWGSVGDGMPKRAVFRSCWCRRRRVNEQTAAK
jgi:hypothetical protein